MELVSLNRETVEAKLFDAKGGIVKLYASATVDDSSKVVKAHGIKEDPETQLNVSLDMICACFVEWNIGKDGVVLPCTQETLRQFTQRDFLVMLQSCTGRELVSQDGKLLSPEEVEKKGKSA